MADETNISHLDESGRKRSAREMMALRDAAG